MSGVPVLVEMDGLHVVVIGGGPVAERRIVSMLEAGACVSVVAPGVTPAIESLERDGRCTLARRGYASIDLEGADFVVAATNDDAVNAAVTRDARAAHVLVNAAFDGRQGSADVMATHRAGPLVIGVSAGVPAATLRIRDAIAARFNESFASALTALADARRRMIDAGSREEWRSRSSSLIDERFCERVEHDDVPAQVRSWP